MRAVALAVGGGLVHGALFPPIGAWPLAFVALAPLLVAVRGRRPLAGAVLGWAEATTGAMLAVVPWIAEAARDFFGIGAPGATAIGLGVAQVFGALPIALFGAAATRITRLEGAIARTTALAAAWTAVELGRAELLTGAPWDLLGHAVVTVPLLTQLADVGGVFVVSFVLALASAAAAECATAPAGEARRACAVAAVAVAGMLAYGAFRLETVPGTTERVTIGLVQGDVPNAWRNDPTHVQDALRAYDELTRTIVDRRADLIAWPENAVSVLLEPNAGLRARIVGSLAGTSAPLLLGAPRYAASGDGRVALFNSAHLLSPEGASLAAYDKRHLVPFAEYLPLRHVAGIEWAQPRPGDYTPGSASGVFPSPTPFGVLICFEAIYPELARELVAGGARFLVNLSNDAWFGSAAAREQHFAAVVFRAVELRRPVVRVANAGITAVVDAAGRVTDRFPTDVRGAWIVSIVPSDVVTPCARVGNLFAWLAALAATLAVVRAR